MLQCLVQMPTEPINEQIKVEGGWLFAAHLNSEHVLKSVDKCACVAKTAKKNHRACKTCSLYIK